MLLSISTIEGHVKSSTINTSKVNELLRTADKQIS
jgi:hypothetical protein